MAWDSRASEWAMLPAESQAESGNARTQQVERSLDWHSDVSPQVTTSLEHFCFGLACPRGYQK